MLISQPVTSCLTNHSELGMSRLLNNQPRRIYRLQRRPSLGFESSVSSTMMTSDDPVLARFPRYYCYPLPSNRHHRSNGDCLEEWRVRRKIIRSVLCAVLCATIVHSAMHTHTNRPNSSLDWVLSHWAHFSVFRLIFVCITVYHVVRWTWWD